METQITWDDVLHNKKLIGGDIEIQDTDFDTCGPLSEIEQRANVFFFHQPWRALCDPKTGEWSMCGVITVGVHTNRVVPYINYAGCVIFYEPFLGQRITLVPKGKGTLDPAKVHGLPRATERFLALYPNLQFDRELAIRVMEGRRFKTLERFLALPNTATAGIQDLLNTFNHDRTAEKFLHLYVEALTGETNVSEKVY